MPSYFLLDHVNPHGPHFYSTRKNALTCVVLHVTAGLQDSDMVGPDTSAENTAKYAAQTERAVSWHGGSDSDTFLYLLPPSYTAFHCRGLNSRSYGWEMSKKDVVWATQGAAWVSATLRNTAKGLAPIVREFAIPLVRISLAEANKGVKGFIYHSDADSTRRSDPGKDFPIDLLFEYIREELGEQSRKVQDQHAFPLLEKGSKGSAVRDLQGHLNAAYDKYRDTIAPLEITGVFDERTYIRLRDWQRRAGLKVDGLVGPKTWKKLHTVTDGLRITPDRKEF